jgi:mono/diheme cytochrome c family protein
MDLKQTFFILIIALLLAACGGAQQTADPPTADPQIEKGRQVFQLNCAACHATAPDTVVIGPSLAGIATAAATRQDGVSAREFIENSIIKPDAILTEGYPDIMPKTFGTTLSGEDFDALVAYLLTLE